MKLSSILNLIKFAKHALAGDGSAGGKIQRRQSRLFRYDAAEMLYNGMNHDDGFLSAPEALAVGNINSIS
jgi:hypothetical protein